MVRILALSVLSIACADELPPNLQAFIDLARDDPEAAVEEIRKMDFPTVQEIAMPALEGIAAAGNGLPTVVGHGMGDSCFNRGMKSITKGISNKTGTYATCIPTGGNVLSDTINGFLKTMDSSIDLWAEKIRADPELANGFNCIGFSQGNSQCRGYIQKYNDPPVHTFISVHGTVMGVQAFPGCFSQGKPLGLICRTFAEVLGDLAYNPLVQNVLYQANYYRDAKKVTHKGYLKYSQIAQWNNENPDNVNQTMKDNFVKTKYAMVKAAGDSMVYPNEGEQWGAINDDGKTIQSMKDTKYYQQDLFGLKTVDEANPIAFEETSGNHLQFTAEELYGWVEKYFMNSDVIV
jgi:palmitoyl-protein thioesterase